MALPITPAQQELCLQAARKTFIAIEDPGNPKTPEERRLARLWFNDVVTGFVERRRDPVIKSDVTS